MGRAGPHRDAQTAGTHRTLVLLAALTLLLKSLVFAPIGIWPAGFLCLVPWLVFIGRAERAPRVYLYSFLWSLAFFLINMRWLYFATGVGYVALSFYQAFYFPLMACVLRSAVRRRRWPLAIVFPIVWTGSEMLRAVVLSGFPWFFLSHGMSSVLPLIQVSDLVGAYGVSFLVASVNGLLADLVMTRWLPERMRLNWQGPRAFWPSAIACAVMIAAALGYGAFRLLGSAQVDGPKVTVLQGDFINTVEGNDESPEEKRRIYFAMMDEAARSQPEMFLLPETPWFMYLNKETRDYSRLFVDSFEMFRDRARKYNAYIVTGSTTSIPTPGSLLAKERQHNSASIFAPGADEPQRYDKVHLVVFGEYVPFRFGRLRFLYFWLNSLMPFSHGGEREYSLFPGEHFLTFDMAVSSRPGHPYRFGVPICYEDVMPYVARKFCLGEDGRKKVDFLLNISNDGWFGRGIQQPQHLAICVFRAVENRVGIARAVNTGISGFVEPSGRLHDLVQRDADGRWPGQCGYATARIKVDPRLTFYTRHGDWFGWGCAAVWLLLFCDYWFARARGVGSSDVEGDPR